ncbi:MAG: hypothetical protein KME25_31585 [Symplocastrum torsivum CPER-KK1]|uniref:Uncharacterized protein n=1 Tax=Symplocastrum torsivum CPER-KK1 TaxID=450513 RepID=A0A951PTY8_9CYAN|nr:hypothetical protein [Symplocastrum torsivum CPER-KK1]
MEAITASGFCMSRNAGTSSRIRRSSRSATDRPGTGSFSNPRCCRVALTLTLFGVVVESLLIGQECDLPKRQQPIEA